MPDYPAEIIHAAVEALMERRGLTSESSRLWAAPIVATVLDTAAPLLAEHCAQAILAHMEAHAPGRTDWWHYRQHFGIAARIASTGFSTHRGHQNTTHTTLAPC